MPEIIRAKNKRKKKLNLTMLWIIACIVINSIGLFLVVRWYGQFIANQRPLTDIDESAFKIFTNPASDKQVLTPSQRQLLKGSLSQQTVEDFLFLDLLKSLKFRNLKTNYEPQESVAAITSTEEIEDDLSGLVIGNPNPFDN